MVAVSNNVREKVIETLKNIYDPEIPIDIWDLGLVYDLQVSEEGDVHVVMTLTAPGCPLANTLVMLVEDAIRSIDGVRNVTVDLTFNPPWDPKKMTPEGRELFKKLYGYDILEYWESIYGKKPTA
ncbi:MAG: iron-sulfur cluster assembly protein [Zestosphaera sp.]